MKIHLWISLWASVPQPAGPQSHPCSSYTVSIPASAPLPEGFASPGMSSSSISLSSSCLTSTSALRSTSLQNPSPQDCSLCSLAPDAPRFYSSGSSLVSLLCSEPGDIGLAPAFIHSLPAFCSQHRRKLRPREVKRLRNWRVESGLEPMLVRLPSPHSHFSLQPGQSMKRMGGGPVAHSPGAFLREAGAGGLERVF